MGRWGQDTFENDTALDFLGDQIASLRAAIRESLYGEDQGDPDTPVLAAVACLRSLMAGIPDARSMLPRLEAEAWKLDYQAWLEEQGEAEEIELEEQLDVARREFDGLLQWVQEQPPGLHPFMDLLVHDKHPFAPDVEELVLKLHEQNPSRLWRLDEEPYDWTSPDQATAAKRWLAEELSSGDDQD